LASGQWVGIFSVVAKGSSKWAQTPSWDAWPSTAVMLSFIGPMKSTVRHFKEGSNRRESSLKEHELYHEKGDLGVGQVFEIHALRVMISKPSLLEISI